MPYAGAHRGVAFSVHCVNGAWKCTINKESFGHYSERDHAIRGPIQHVASIFPNEASIVRLVGAILLEQNDEWAVTRHYMSLETMVGLCNDPGVGSKAIPAT
jgi:hypothetical protein